MSKYQPLSEHLGSIKVSAWKASFSEIEGILGFGLPMSAYSYSAWWANQSASGHSQSASWTSIMWRTQDLDLENQEVTFSREQLPDFSTEGKNAVRRDEHTYVAQDQASTVRRSIGAITLAEAKSGLAAYFGVPPENIVITIQG